MGGMIDTSPGEIFNQSPGGKIEAAKPWELVQNPATAKPLTVFGVTNPPINVAGPAKEETKYEPGHKQYEFSNHLGNVLVTVSDMPLGVDVGNDGNVDYYMPDVKTTSDYEPFGAPLEGRTLSENGGYDFGFQGQGKENDLYGEGNALTFEYRIHDARIGRFFSVDPIAGNYAWNSPYGFSENRVIDGIELEGLERIDVEKVGEVRIERPSIIGNEGQDMDLVVLEVYKMVVNMEYMIVNDHGMEVPGIDKTAFHNTYAKGNTSFYSNSITPGSIEANGNGKYLIHVEYNFNIVGEAPLSKVLDWYSGDNAARGIIAGFIGPAAPRIIISTPIGIKGPTPMGWEGPPRTIPFAYDLLYSSVSVKNIYHPEFHMFGEFIKGYPMKAFNNPNVGGISTPGDMPWNFVAINLATTMTLSRILIAVHECGHNAAGKHLHGQADGQYEYNQDGLQSNTNPYPTLQNTINILNDQTNWTPRP